MNDAKTHLQEVANTQIRDADLLEELERHRHTIGFTAMTNELRRRQFERDAQEKYLSSLTLPQRKRFLASQKLETEAIKPENLRHIHSVLAICSLPYRKQPIETREFERKQGRMSLVVEAGKLLSPTGERIAQPLPYGSRARLLLLHLCSEAIRQKSPTIHIEDSLTAFIRSIGFSVTGGKNGTLTSFKQQINALAACRMSIGVWNGTRARTINAQPFSQIDVWLPTDPDQKMLWPSTITFSRDFYDTLTQHALPVNMHAVKHFANSPRKLDLLFWIGYRLNTIRKPLHISWGSLQEQFGGSFVRARKFREHFIGDVEHLKEVFPKLPLSLDEFGLTIDPADPTVLAIPKRKKT